MTRAKAVAVGILVDAAIAAADYVGLVEGFAVLELFRRYLDAIAEILSPSESTRAAYAACRDRGFDTGPRWRERAEWDGPIVDMDDGRKVDTRTGRVVERYPL